jgi:hypothetical protein
MQAEIVLKVEGTELLMKTSRGCRDEERILPAAHHRISRRSRQAGNHQKVALYQSHRVALVQHAQSQRSGL